ncbi:glycosyltransferase [Rathayibacter caricis]|uniref:glycosyltransferase n=1 Tax=Rathayibacter caricis TaxID=110936 RepID=UPI001FB31045|nr:glycosyltransferase [Rathayibacter caricis]MCJ1694904.1 glycosyltransferase [Rathayibacter caricis]
MAHNYTPLGRSSVTFIHDLLFEVEPSWFSFAERLYFWPMSRLAVRAVAVATSSRTEAARMERLHPGLSPVHPIGLAVATELRAAVPSRPTSVAGLESFALSVGRLNARKNLVNAILGTHASGRLSPSSPLLVVGSAEYSGVGAALPPAVERLVDERSVVFLGRVSDGELRWLYEHAAVTIYCSLDEGFGLPPVEAAAFGSPLVVSDRPIFRETVREHAVFADPLDPASIAAAVDSTWGTRGRGRGGRSPVEYSWIETVDRLRELCATAASRH